MRINFYPAAREDIERMFAWIAQDNPSAALEMVSRIESAIYRLAVPELSHMGHAGTVAGTLELVVHPYIIVYKVNGKRREIAIISIVHGARDR
jgi:toxin ParE1/3/4